ncbi:MAG: fumarate hydratase, partial [Candidatus Bathyarchaeia archaeon]
MVGCSLVREVALKLLELAAIRLPDDVKDALRRAYYEERSSIGRLHLQNILENIKLAEAENIPVCQDTGTISFYLRAGSRFKGLGEVEK